jgi:tetratricopeptide (TPR) repeat protein
MATQGPFSEYNMGLGDTGYTDLYQQALNYMRGGSYLEAEQVYLQLADLEPDNANAVIGLGASLLLQDKLEQSMEAYQRAVELAPQSVQAHIGLGSAAFRSGQVQLAGQNYRLALDMDETNTDALWGMALTLEASGRQGEAEGLLKRIVSLEPQSSLAEAARQKLQAFTNDSGSE